ncbi:hypothetical protein ACNJQJ_21390, partial [Mycobacterium tuberculosis]
MWDCGSTGLNAIVSTFVFSVYLTSALGDLDTIGYRNVVDGQQRGSGVALRQDDGCTINADLLLVA